MLRWCYGRLAYVSIQSWGAFAPYLKYIPLPVRQILAAYVPNQQFQKMRTISLALDQHARQIYYSKHDALANGDEAVLQQMEEKSILSVLSTRFDSTALAYSQVLANTTFID